MVQPAVLVFIVLTLLSLLIWLTKQLMPTQRGRWPSSYSGGVWRVLVYHTIFVWRMMTEQCLATLDEAEGRQDTVREEFGAGGRGGQECVVTTCGSSEHQMASW